MDSRFLQANERTLLAWLRTGLGLSAFGFAVSKSSTLLRLLAPEAEHAPHPLNSWLGVMLVIVGASAMLIGLVRYHRVRAALLAERDVPESHLAVTFLAAVTILVALSLGVYQLLM